LLLCSALSAGAAEVKLTGIVCAHFGKVALIEVGPARLILHEGESVQHRPGERVALVRIDEKAGRVTIEEEPGRQTTYSVNGREGVANQTFNLKDASSAELLDIYQDITGRTILRSPTLVHARVSLESGAGLSRVEAEKLLAGALKEQGVFVIMRYDKFAFAVPFSQIARLDQIPEPPAPSKSPPSGQGAASKEESFPPGLIKFQEADLSQVLGIFQELTGRTVLKAADLPHAKITLRSQTQLSRTEAIWMFETAARLGGVALLSKERFVFALPNTRDVAPPEFETNSSLATGGDPLPPGALKFSEATGRQLLELYAQLLGRDAVLENVPACRFTLRSQTSLTRPEAIYALDAAAALNNVRFVVTDKQVKLIPAAKARKDAETK
jgi:hypothetical protein